MLFRHCSVVRSILTMAMVNRVCPKQLELCNDAPLAFWTTIGTKHFTLQLDGFDMEDPVPTRFAYVA